MKLSVSYLSSKYNKEETIKKINETNADFLHVDLMDGLFAGVNNYQKEEVIELLKLSTKPLDIHLMMENPDDVIRDLAKLKPYMITIHVEINDVLKNLKLIQTLGIKAGLAINPDTSIELVRPFLKEIDRILIMSVNPGYGGQKFIPEVLEKARPLLDIKRAIDGGINDETFKLVKDYVDTVVVGSFICQSDNYQEQIKKIIP